MSDMNERYETQSLITRNDRGTVERAFDRQSKRLVAVKRASGPDAEAALVSESAILGTLHHPNIVTILDSGRDSQGGFMVTELADGQSLETLTATQRLSLSAFEQLVEQTLDAVGAAHEKNVLHLDIKPQNIMVAVDVAGRLSVKLLDFGAARSGAVVADKYSPVMGSLFFMAPERFDRAPADTRADLYSLGCVYYQALAGRPPFTGDTGPQVMVAHLRHQFAPLAEIRPDLPAYVPRWVEWLFSQKPEDRPASASAAFAAFRAQRAT